MATLDEIFADQLNKKLTENGDDAFYSTTNPLLDLLFMAEYYQKSLDEVKIGNSALEQLFAMFMRDPRHGLGYRDLGRELMKQSGVDFEGVLKAGRADYLFTVFSDEVSLFDFLKKEIEKGNYLIKKWMPRYSSKNLMLARKIAKHWKMNKQQYGKFIKCTTVESNLSRKTTDEIHFEYVPSLAMIKYYDRFLRGEDTAKRFEQYLEDVRSGKKKLNVSVTTVYDIYCNRNRIDADLFFDKLEKISGSWMPIVDTSASMQTGDAMGKALSIGHYLSKCSSYMPNKVITFSSTPNLLTLGVENEYVINRSWSGPKKYKMDLSAYKDGYEKEIASMKTGDCSNTDLAAVMDLLCGLDKEHQVSYIVILSDMEFDRGSSMSKDALMRIFKQKGITTKIVWWNLNGNGRDHITPETDKYGNIFMSGYNPMLLKFLQAGFDGTKFLNILLEEYKKAIAD